MGNVRNRAKVANIQATLRNAQTAGEIYYNNNNFTYAGICGDVTITGTSPNKVITYEDSPIQQHIDALQALDSNIKVGCWVMQGFHTDYPKIGIGSQTHELQLDRQDWALTIHFNNNHYSVNPQGVITFDISTVQQSSTNWEDAKDLCAIEGKRLPSPSQLRALRMAHGDPASGAEPWNSNDSGISANWYWSNIERGQDSGWATSLNSGSVQVHSVGRHVHCVS